MSKQKKLFASGIFNIYNLHMCKDMCHARGGGGGGRATEKTEKTEILANIFQRYKLFDIIARKSLTETHEKVHAQPNQNTQLNVQLKKTLMILEPKCDQKRVKFKRGV